MEHPYRVKFGLSVENGSCWTSVVVSATSVIDAADKGARWAADRAKLPGGEYYQHLTVDAVELICRVEVA